jgi:hypothetical protein
MKKLAVFVEGQTEQAFAEALLYAIARRHQVHIDTVHAHGGRVLPRTFVEVGATSRPDPGKRYYVIIYDSSGDSRVLSDIRDHYDNLASQGFAAIIGVRDVLPQPAADVPNIRADFAALAPSHSVPTTLVLSIMEIEAWVIAEHTHFPKMHPYLNPAAVTGALGYDPETHDIQLVPQPAEDLKKVYMLAGLGYNKSRSHVQRTLSALDFPYIYVGLRARFPDLETLADCIDRFLS